MYTIYIDGYFYKLTYNVKEVLDDLSENTYSVNYGFNRRIYITLIEELREVA